MVNQKFLRCLVLLLVFVAFGAMVACFGLSTNHGPFGESAVWAQDFKPLDKPPAGQTYVGEKTCASCHFEQDLVWRKTKHAKGFEILPAKYREDKSCLKCHATGFGEETGFKSLDSTPALAGTSCEACHGPGSEHTKIGKQFFGKELTEAQKKYVASSIYKFQPKNVCAECHLAQAHKKHPAYDKE